ncbi:MAG: hypothetical protein Kow0025_05910 [Thermodesulfovibrionales bacterium]
MPEIGQRLRACIAMEEACARAYDALRGLFADDPGAAALWSGLAADEREHASALTLAKVAERIGQLPADFVPASFPAIYKAYNMAINLRERALEPGLGLREALDLCLSLESSTAESYFFDVMNRETGSEAVRSIQKIYRKEISHAEKVARFMRERGMAPPRSHKGKDRSGA